MTTYSEAVLRRAAKAVFLACEASVADDISAMLIWAANEIERLKRAAGEA